jgi:DDE family transposase
MTHATLPAPPRQVAHTCRQLYHNPGLPFADHLPAQRIEQTLRSLGHTFRHRLFCPALTLWTFLSQVLDPDHSCRAAVARVLAWRARRGLPPGSADTGAYCKARQRLPQELLAQLTRDTGREGLAQAAPAWRWQGRPVKVVDGTGLSMPDTRANRKHYPPSRQARPGCGFPLMRLVVLFSLAVGTALDAAFGPHRGKGTGELSLWRTLEHGLQAGDVLLADRGFCCFWTLAQAQARGADAVLRLHQGWIKDARWGRRLGAGSRGLRLGKPARPAWMEAADYQALPEQLHLRTVAVRVRQRGFRTRALVVVTTLVDPAAVPASALAELYRMRWQVEIDQASCRSSSRLYLDGIAA